MIKRVSLFNPRNRQDWKDLLTGLCIEGPGAILLMVAEMTAFDYEEIRPLFKETGVPVMGGVFPGIIYGDSWYSEGIIGCGIQRPVTTNVVKNLETFKGLPESDAAAGTYRTYLLIVDGMARKISSFLNKLFETCSGRASFIGGGAGSLGLERKPVLFTEEELFAGGALLIGIHGPIGVGVSHGWKPIYGPLVANRTVDNVMVELNWQPAFSAYRQILEEKAGISIDSDNFFEVSKCYPFGMVKIDKSIVIRDPIRQGGEGDIVLVGEIPENSVVMILKGEPEMLVNAAGKAASKALARFREQTGSAGQNALVIDCISRVLCLGEEIARELRSIRANIPPEMQTFGFLSLGEIASYGDIHLEFFNKTTVVGVG